MSGDKRKKKYFPHNWEEIAQTPAEMFAEIEYDEFMEWKIAGWELPSSVSCIIREWNKTTSKCSERVYERPSAANNRLKKIMASDDDIEVTFINAQQCVVLSRKPIEDFDYE